MKYFVNVWLVKRIEPNGKVYIDYQNAYKSRKTAQAIAIMEGNSKVFPGRQTAIIPAKLTWDDTQETM